MSLISKLSLTAAAALPALRRGRVAAVAQCSGGRLGASRRGGGRLFGASHVDPHKVLWGFSPLPLSVRAARRRDRRESDAEPKATHSGRGAGAARGGRAGAWLPAPPPWCAPFCARRRRFATHIVSAVVRDALRRDSGRASWLDIPRKFARKYKPLRPYGRVPSWWLRGLIFRASLRGNTSPYAFGCLVCIRRWRGDSTQEHPWRCRRFGSPALLTRRVAARSQRCSPWRCRPGRASWLDIPRKFARKYKPLRPYGRVPSWWLRGLIFRASLRGNTSPYALGRWPSGCLLGAVAIFSVRAARRRDSVLRPRPARPELAAVGRHGARWQSWRRPFGCRGFSSADGRCPARRHK